jgi:DNA repair protein RadC
MSIRDWPSGERPREKFLQHGPSSLSDAELLALFVRTGSRDHSALDIARDLLARFGGLRSMLAAPIRELCEVRGLGVSKCVQIHAARELGVRYLGEQLVRGGALESPRDAADFLTLQLRDLPVEVFGCVFLDNRHHVIAYENLFEGTINGASVYTREVVRRVIHHNAAAIIVAHNHPSGIAEPSQADISITRRLKDALALVDVRLLDHLVIGNGECVSLSEKGLF